LCGRGHAAAWGKGCRRDFDNRLECYTNAAFAGGEVMRSLTPIIARETQAFIAAHPKSAAQASALAQHWLHGAPMHWMRDWASPFPIVVEDAEGATLTDVDDNVYDDFCLGDTPGMFGHGLAPVARAVAEQARRGATFMLPTEIASEVGALLATRFGLPYWQATLSASDANRALIRWARAVTDKPVIVVFDGCYHGMVEDCFVELRHGRTRPDVGLVGQVFDMTRTTRAVPFNDLGALEAALAQGDVAAVLAEPAMTNCGMILPEPGFHARLRALTGQAGALLILDETHTLSTGPGGATKAWGLEPDALCIGKAIAGGFPAAVWGVSAEFARRIGEVRRGEGRSGIGTTLAGNAAGLAAIAATLKEVATDDAYANMLKGAAILADGLDDLIKARGLPWCTVQIGARVEIVFAPRPPSNAAEMRVGLAQRELSHAIHLYLINRGILIASFHMMMLVSPATTAAQIERLIAAVDSFTQESG
jgi:glutamate-1-semialdehyde 2,1-aminomutase